jgi:hypothetical protein
MRALPPKMVQVLTSFAPLFSKRVWQHAQLLLVSEDPLLVRDALAVGGDLRGGA